MGENDFFSRDGEKLRDARAPLASARSNTGKVSALPRISPPPDLAHLWWLPFGAHQRMGGWHRSTSRTPRSPALRISLQNLKQLPVDALVGAGRQLAIVTLLLPWLVVPGARADGLAWRKDPMEEGSLLWRKDDPDEARLAEEVLSRPAAAPAADGGASAEPIVGVPVEEPFTSPGLGGGLPTAYTAGWGDYFVVGAVATPGKLREGTIDASITTGFGVGDLVRTAAVEVDWNINSIRNFNDNGTFNLRVGRMLVNHPRLQVAAGGGVLNVLRYGLENPPGSEANLYGVVTVAVPLRTPDPYFARVLQFSAGVGGNNFAYADANFEGPDTGYFAAVGMEITSNVGLSVGASGRGTNVNVSYVPFRGFPLTINVTGADVFDTSPSGTQGVLSLAWGDNFRTGIF
jgi:hypothetical protein